MVNYNCFRAQLTTSHSISLATILGLSSHLCLHRGLLPSGLRTKNLYAFLQALPHTQLLDLIIIMIFAKQYKYVMCMHAYARAHVCMCVWKCTFSALQTSAKITFYITFNHWGWTVKYKLALYVKHEYYMNQNHYDMQARTQK